MRSNAEPMRDVARMIRNHFDGIIAWTQSRQTPGVIDAINGLFQAAIQRDIVSTKAGLVLACGEAEINQKVEAGGGI